MEERHLLYRIAEGCRIAAFPRDRFGDRAGCQPANYVKRVNCTFYGGLRLFIECWLSFVEIGMISSPNALLDCRLG